MNISREKIYDDASSLGFQPDVLEKAYRLLGILDAINQHPDLEGRWVLKGGTAINLFHLNTPRLSVDIDLNYVGQADVEEMKTDRPRQEKAISAVCGREGFQVRRIPQAHAGGKWRLGYTDTTGGSATLELDLNYLHRAPLWPQQLAASRLEAPGAGVTFPLLDIHELAASKLCALFERKASRDLFDAYRLFEHGEMDVERLRLGFVTDGAMRRRDWSQIRISEIEFDAKDLRVRLLPMLRSSERPEDEVVERWARKIEEVCRQHLSRLLPFRENEVEFIRRVNEQGEVDGGLLTEDRGISNRIERLPGLHWKVKNVREYRALDRDDFTLNM